MRSSPYQLGKDGFGYQVSRRCSANHRDCAIVDHFSLQRGSSGQILLVAAAPILAQIGWFFLFVKELRLCSILILFIITFGIVDFEWNIEERNRLALMWYLRI